MSERQTRKPPRETMAKRSGAFQAKNPQKERRRFSRFRSSIAVELKASPDRCFKGNLLNISRGGGLLETGDVLPPKDLFRVRIGEDGSGNRGVILLARPAWGMVVRAGKIHRYGLAFLKGQVESYERMRALAEVVQAKNLAQSLGLKYIEITPAGVERNALRCISRSLAFSFNCVPIKLRGDRLMVAMAAIDLRTMEKLRLFSRCQIFPVVATRSAIRSMLHQCWGPEYVSAPQKMRAGWTRGRHLEERKSRTIALVSNREGSGRTHLAINTVALLTRLGKRAVSIDVTSGNILLPHEIALDVQEPIPRFSPLEASFRRDALQHLPGLWRSDHEDYEWRILNFPVGIEPLNLDWTLLSDEILLVVLPEHWMEGCEYIRELFHRFVGAESQAIPVGEAGRRVLDLSVVCSRISDIRQGFKVFNQIEVWSHGHLDMVEPGFDLRLHYLGGILNDSGSVRRAEKTKSPLITVRPHSPAAQCMIHIAHALLKPVPERDPRMRFDGSRAATPFGPRGQTEEAIPDSKG